MMLMIIWDSSFDLARYVGVDDIFLHVSSFCLFAVGVITVFDCCSSISFGRVESKPSFFKICSVTISERIL